MVETVDALAERRLGRIEPDDRLVVLARTLHAEGSGPETAWKENAANWTRFGDTCLGQSLYRHCSVFKMTSEAPVWSHLELSYFRDLVPLDAIRELVFEQQPVQARLLRAEILLTTPSAFVMPLGWQGSADRPDRKTSIEYIDVRPTCLGEYRDIMRRYIGPAAAKLVAVNEIGTFRTMETAAVLYRDLSLSIDWNQIHLSEVDADRFEGFGQAFDAALRDISPDGGFAGVFAGLGRMRAIPRWTFNDPVVEADLAVGRFCSTQPLLG